MNSVVAWMGVVFFGALTILLEIPLIAIMIDCVWWIIFNHNVTGMAWGDEGRLAALAVTTIAGIPVAMIFGAISNEL